MKFKNKTNFFFVVVVFSVVTNQKQSNIFPVFLFIFIIPDVIYCCVSIETCAIIHRERVNFSNITAYINLIKFANIDNNFYVFARMHFISNITYITTYTQNQIHALLFYKIKKK